jgi:UDPglucose--hexose-1-phosphate uridylyltransferase
MPELRIDPIVGRRVYIAEDRAGRPNDYVGWDKVPPEAESASPQLGPRPSLQVSGCFFCAGNEVHTPIASATVLDAEGRWKVRVVPNKYPAVTLGAQVSDAFGAHEVIIESPDHVLDFADLGVDYLAVVLSVYRDRLAHWAADGRFKHALVFKNSGYDAGASLEHVHSQLIALPYVPAAVQAELDGVAAYRNEHGRCVFCDLIKREVATGERLVLRRDGYVAICAFASRQPYEMWILPEHHRPQYLSHGFNALNEAAVLHELVRRLNVVSPGAPYNLLLHTGPFDVADEAFHWHWEVVPRLTHEAGLEWGGGVYITPLLPERAAAELRSAR